MGHSDILEVIVYFNPPNIVITYIYIFRHLTGTCNCSELVKFPQFRWFGWIYVRYGGSGWYCLPGESGHFGDNGESGKSVDSSDFSESGQYGGAGESGGSVVTGDTVEPCVSIDLGESNW